MFLKKKVRTIKKENSKKFLSLRRLIVKKSKYEKTKLF